MTNSPNDQRREQDEAERQEDERFLALLNERQKRTFLRRIERGEREAAVEFAKAVEKKSGDFDFDGFEDDDEDFSDDGLDDDSSVPEEN